MKILECNFQRCNRCCKCLVNDTIKMSSTGKVRFKNEKWDNENWKLNACEAASYCEQNAFDIVDTETLEKQKCFPD